jgi:N-acetylglutamate synthase-like GNAT family acetyltransferase
MTKEALFNTRSVHIVIMEVSGNVCGGLITTLKSPAEMYIELVCVNQSLKGYGTRLLEHLDEITTTRFPTVEIVSAIAVESSCDFFKKNGYEIHDKTMIKTVGKNK